ncbi:Beta-lactamase/transpeptidase-like protein [Nannochloropsis gaditana]|uniref:Beta-lactamase/transpeptidase-like protein n=1 Tax=Nannochloropsis gaditana TaxID=72520 RepID=W7TA26_9STRA|nr:Beta-lactamase/transpeptidase-like protein [Nannochloropsis gaditana]
MDPRPVSEHTLFPIYDLGNVLTALLLHVHVREGMASKGYETPLKSLLPATLAGYISENVRLKHFLSYATGLPTALPPSLPASTLLDHDACLDLLATTFASIPPLRPPGRQASFSLLDFGHLATALLHESCHLPPSSLPQVFAEKILKPLHLTGGAFLGGFDQGVNGKSRYAQMDHWPSSTTDLRHSSARYSPW